MPTYQFTLTNRFRVTVGALTGADARAELEKALDAGDFFDFADAEGWEVADVSPIRAAPQFEVEYGPEGYHHLITHDPNERTGRP